MADTHSQPEKQAPRRKKREQAPPTLGWLAAKDREHNVRAIPVSPVALRYEAYRRKEDRAQLRRELRQRHKQDQSRRRRAQAAAKRRSDSVYVGNLVAATAAQQPIISAPQLRKRKPTE